MSRRFVLSLAAFAAVLFVLAAPACAQQRIALVIGNAAYPRGPIAHSLADGGLVAEALTSVGFDIVEGADVNSGDMRRLFGEFLARVNAAGPDTIALIYYNGYAIQFEGDNYLIPVDAQINRDSEIPIQGIRLFDLLRPLADTPATTKITVLDAARPLPFQIQGGQLAQGLGAIESAPGLLVAFASAPGTVAPDGPGPYGAYATAIAEMVREPGLDIDTMFARIRLRTNEATQGAQMPWEVSQLQQVAILVPGQPAAPPSGAQAFLAPPQTQVGAPVVRRRAPPRPLRDIGPEDAYAYAVEADELPVYVDYVRDYPNSPYTGRVWAIIRARREALVWREALLTNSPDAYWTYLERYPEGMYGFDARRRLRRLSAGDRPPPGWRMMEFADVPPPLAGEPARFITILPPAPPPRRYLGPPPAFIVGLPPPPRPGGGGLWRRDQPAFPVIIAPPGGLRPGFGPGGRPPGPAIVNQPPPGQPGGPPPGLKGPPPQGQPRVVNQPPQGVVPGGPPPAGGPPAAGGVVPPGPPPGLKGPQGQPKIVNQPPQGGPPGGPPPVGAGGPPAAGGGVPPGLKGPQGQPQPRIVNQPPQGGPPAGGPPPVGAGGPPPGPVGGPPKGPPPGPPQAIKGPPPQFQKGPPPAQLQQQVQPPKQPQVAAPPPPKAPAPPPPPPPVVKGPPPGPPPSPPPGPPGGPPAGAKGPPPGGPVGRAPLPKCALVGGKQPCQP